MMGRAVGWTLAIGLLLLARGVAAEPPEGAAGEEATADDVSDRMPVEPVSGETRGTGEGPEVVEHGSPEAPVQRDPTAEQGRGVQYGAHLVVPVWVTQAVPGDDLRPGVGVQGRIGWEFPRGLSAELFVGYMWNAVGVRDVEAEVDLQNVWVGVGARYAVLNPTAFVPFIGAGVQVDFWRTGGDRTEDTVGFQATVGGIYEVSSKVGIEVGVVANLTTQGDQFDSPEAYLSPFAGATLYF